MDTQVASYLANNKTHLVGNAHLDPVWLWRWTDGFSEVAATFRSALDRINEYPGFVFTCAGAAYYKWIELYYPDMFEEIKTRVKEKRWIVVGGWWIQPDCNIAGGESYARHSLYSQRYYMEKFGILCDTGYNVDSFGHGGMLPQILVKSGMKNYVFMRPGDSEKENVPNVFYWESPDKSKVLTYKIPVSYTTHKPGQFMERLLTTAELGAGQNTDMMLFYGVGNHGGGPTISQLDEIEKRRAEYGSDRIIYSSPKQFMSDISSNEYPVVAGDLQIHAIGCYSTFQKIKKLNRTAENRLLAAEAFDTISHALLGTPLQTKRLALAWEKVMFNQFHDIICGCSIKKAYDDAAEAYGYALHEADDIRNAAVQRIAWAVDTQGEDNHTVSKEDDWRLWGHSGKGAPACVFNPLPYETMITIEFHGEYSLICGDGNQEYIAQRVRGPMSNGKSDRFNTVIFAKLPALGYGTFWLYRKPHDPNCENDLKNSGVYAHPEAKYMENEHIRVTFDSVAGIVSEVYDKKSKSIILYESAKALVIDEKHSDTWGHNLTEYRDVIGSFTPISTKLLESGPVRCRVRICGKYGDSLIMQDFILYAGQNSFEIKYKLNWRETHKMLKIEFNAAFGDGVYLNEIPYGFIERPVDGKEKPIQRWVAYHNEKTGVSIANNACWGADCLNGAIRMTALRSPMFADHYGERDEFSEPMEQGEQEFGFVVAPYGPGCDVTRQAAVYNAEFPIIYGTYHKGKLPLSLPGIEVSCENVYAIALKSSEDQGGFVLRAYETTGMAANASFNVCCLNRAWDAKFAPYEIKTFYMPNDLNKPIREVDLLE